MRVTLTDSRAPESILDTALFESLGLGFLALAKLQYHLRGYSPKPIRPWEIQRKIDHALHIGEKFLQGMARYGVSVQGLDILELGPGDDLGTGAFLLSNGARSYTALDAHPNAHHAPAEFYSRMRERGIEFDQRDLHLKVCRQFSIISTLKPESVDIVVSSSAFEHFDDPRRVIRELSWVVRPGGAIISSVDLQTHSRWIRQVDPNNIYRYPEWLYRLFRFPGQCNRLRMQDYMRFLAEAGWANIDLRPGESSVFENRARVHSRFRACDDLDVLAFSMFATR